MDECFEHEDGQINKAWKTMELVDGFKSSLLGLMLNAMHQQSDFLKGDMLRRKVLEPKLDLKPLGEHTPKLSDLF